MTPPSMPTGIYAAWLHREALDYVQAVRVLDQQDQPGAAGPSSSLLAHALELTLKAFLAAKGYDKPALRGIGCHIVDLLEAALQAGLPDSDGKVLALAQRLPASPAEYRPRYPCGGHEHQAAVRVACEVIEALSKRIGEAVESARIRARLDLLASGASYDPAL